MEDLLRLVPEDFQKGLEGMSAKGLVNTYIGELQRWLGLAQEQIEELNGELDAARDEILAVWGDVWFGRNHRI